MHDISIFIVISVILVMFALAYTFFSNIFPSASITIDYITGNVINVRNTGKIDLTNLSVYLNNAPAYFNISHTVIKKDETATIIIYDFIKENDEIKITSAQGTSASKKAPDPCNQAVLCLKFDEGSGSITKDSSTYGKDGTIYGATWVDGKYGKALNFSGNDFINILDFDAIDLTPRGISIETWIKLRDTPIGQQIINKNNEYQLRIDSPAEGKNISCLIHFMGFSGKVSSAFVPSFDTWYYVVCIWDGYTLSLYVNGTLTNSKSGISGIISPTTNPLEIGAVDGIIDEVRIYNKAIY